MLKTVVIGSVASLIAAAALFAGAASATGYLKREAATVAAPLAPEVAGDCVVQMRWVKSAGQMVQVERPVCY
jgi:hypothetical protein